MIQNVNSCFVIYKSKNKAKYIYVKTNDYNIILLEPNSFTKKYEIL